MNVYRVKITEFLQWNDKNCCYTYEVIKYAKDNNFYDLTYEKLKLLINNYKLTIEFYKDLV